MCNPCNKLSVHEKTVTPHNLPRINDGTNTYPYYLSTRKYLIHVTLKWIVVKNKTVFNAFPSNKFLRESD